MLTLMSILVGLGPLLSNLFYTPNIKLREVFRFSKALKGFPCNYFSLDEVQYGDLDCISQACSMPCTSLHCTHCDKIGHVKVVCFTKHPKRKNQKLENPQGKLRGQPPITTTPTPINPYLDKTKNIQIFLVLLLILKM